jgi:hypothetical protein
MVPCAGPSLIETIWPGKNCFAGYHIRMDQGIIFSFFFGVGELIHIAIAVGGERVITSTWARTCLYSLNIFKPVALPGCRPVYPVCNNQQSKSISWIFDVVVQMVFDTACIHHAGRGNDD